MNFLKNLTVSLFSFLLFLSLTIFGLAFALKSTAMNPDFVTNELNQLNIAATVKDLVQVDPPPEIPNLNEIIYKTISSIEPKFKEESGFAIHSVYAYLLGDSKTPDLRSILRKTYLSTDFTTPLVNSIDITQLLAPTVSRQIAQAIAPVQIPNINKYVTDAMTSAEPAFKQQVIAAAGQISDYLLGTSTTLNTSISLVQAEAGLKSTLRQVFINSPPAGVVISGIPLTSIPINLRAAAFDLYYPTIESALPKNYTIDQSVITPQMRADISNKINSAEDGLLKIRGYVAKFQQYYTLLLILMAVLTLGIILIVRNVKDITHRLGIPLLTYGAMEYAGVLVTKYLISSGRMKFPDIPPQLQTWLLQLISDSMKPVEIFSIILLIAGIILTVTSFVYKPKQELKWS